MPARGPQNGRRCLRRGPTLGYLLLTFAKKGFFYPCTHSFFEKRHGGKKGEKRKKLWKQWPLTLLPNGGCLQRHRLGLGTNQNQDQRYIFLNHSAREGRGVNNPVLFMKIREENLYPVDFSCFTYKILVFQTFFEKLQLKNLIKSYYWGGLSKKRQNFQSKKVEQAEGELGKKTCTI